MNETELLHTIFTMLGLILFFAIAGLVSGFCKVYFKNKIALQYHEENLRKLNHDISVIMDSVNELPPDEMWEKLSDLKDNNVFDFIFKEEL